MSAALLNTIRSEEHTSELQSPDHLVCRLLLEKKKKKKNSLFFLKNKKKKKINDIITSIILRICFLLSFSLIFFCFRYFIFFFFFFFFNDTATTEIYTLSLHDALPICPDSNNILNIIQNTIQNFSFSDLSDISSTKIQQLHNNLITYHCFSLTQSTSFNTTTFYTTIQGFIPILLINTISQYTSYKNVSNIIIKLLLLISQKTYEQLWKPYCTNLEHWKTSQDLL